MIRRRTLSSALVAVTVVGSLALAGSPASAGGGCVTVDIASSPEKLTLLTELGERFERGVADGIAEHGLPWSVTRLGCRAEYMFSASPPRTGGEAAAARSRVSSRRTSTSEVQTGVATSSCEVLISPCSSSPKRSAACSTIPGASASAPVVASTRWYSSSTPSVSPVAVTS